MKYIFAIFVLCSLSLADLAKSSKLTFDAELSNFNYPFNVKSFNLHSQNQSLKMRYMDVGDKKSSKVIVLLHGKNFAGFYWEKIAKELMTRGYRVIIPDQIGFGKSSKPHNYAFSFSQLALNTQSLLEHLGIKKYSVVGHSMGGMLAVNISYLYGDKVDKLILINPIGLEPYLDYVKFKDSDFFFKKELAKTVEKIRNYQKKNYYDGKWNDAYEKLLTPFKGWLNGNEWKYVAWNNALTYAPIFSEDIVSKFPKIKNETHLIIGTRDRTGPGRFWKKEGVKYKLGQYQYLGKQAHRKIKNSKLYELKGLGHMPHFEDYKRFSKVFYSILK